MLQQLGCFGLFYVVGNAMVNNLDFEKELGFYGAYHQNPVNQAIHFVFVPTIWWSICVALAYLPFPGGENLMVVRSLLTFSECCTCFLISRSHFGDC